MSLTELDVAVLLFTLLKNNIKSIKVREKIPHVEDHGAIFLNLYCYIVTEI